MIFYAYIAFDMGHIAVIIRMDVSHQIQTYSCLVQRQFTGTFASEVRALVIFHPFRHMVLLILVLF